MELQERFSFPCFNFKLYSIIAVLLLISFIASNTIYNKQFNDTNGIAYEEFNGASGILQNDSNGVKVAVGKEFNGKKDTVGEESKGPKDVVGKEFTGAKDAVGKELKGTGDAVDEKLNGRKVTVGKDGTKDAVGKEFDEAKATVEENIKGTKGSITFAPHSDYSRCSGDKIWKDYALYHKRVLSGEENGTYLIYQCNKFPCGGFGNRMMGISISLLFSIAFKRVFLLEHKYPIPLTTVLQPNEIQWNKTLTSKQLENARHLYIIDIPTLVPAAGQLANLLMDSFDGVITLQTNLQFSHFKPKMPEKFWQLYRKFFDDKSEAYDAQYGCVFHFLFKYLPFVKESISKEMQHFNLEYRQFMAVHIRVYPWKGLDFVKEWGNCTLAVANSIQEHLPIFVMTNEDYAVKYLNEMYPGRMKFSRTEDVNMDVYKKSHTDEYRVHSAATLFNDIELAASAKIFIKSFSTLSNIIAGIGGLAVSTDMYENDSIKKYCQPDIVTEA